MLQAMTLRWFGDLGGRLKPLRSPAWGAYGFGPWPSDRVSGSALGRFGHRRVRFSGIGASRVQFSDVGASRVRRMSIWRRKSALDGRNPNPGCANGRNPNPESCRGTEPEPGTQRTVGTQNPQRLQHRASLCFWAKTVDLCGWGSILHQRLVDSARCRHRAAQHRRGARLGRCPRSSEASHPARQGCDFKEVPLWTAVVVHTVPFEEPGHRLRGARSKRPLSQQLNCAAI